MAKRKGKFQTQIKCNFFALVEREAEGKQELFMLCVPERKEKKYILFSWIYFNHNIHYTRR